MSEILPFPSNPSNPSKKRGRRLPQCLTDAEYAAVVTRARFETEEAHTPSKRYAAARDEVLLHLGLRLGLRLSEFINLDCDQLDFSARRCRILHGKGDKDRTVGIPVDLVPLLRGWVGDRRTGPMFPSNYAGMDRLEGSTIEWRMQRLGELAEMTRRLKPHMLRHTSATMLLRKCGNIMIVKEFLGHNDVSTTMIYTSVSADEVAAAMDL